MSNTLVWINLPGIPMEFWMMQALWDIGNHLGKTILDNDNFLDEGFKLITWILVDLDIIKGLFKSIDLVLEEKMYS
jgi:hypothetical protein